MFVWILLICGFKYYYKLLMHHSNWQQGTVNVEEVLSPIAPIYLSKSNGVPSSRSPTKSFRRYNTLLLIYLFPIRYTKLELNQLIVFLIAHNMFNSNEDEKMKKKKKDLVLKTYLDGDGTYFNNEDLAFLLKKLKNICIEMRKDVISREQTWQEQEGSVECHLGWTRWKWNRKWIWRSRISCLLYGTPSWGSKWRFSLNSSNNLDIVNLSYKELPNLLMITLWFSC